MSAVVHWYFGWLLCEEHGDRSDVNCQECLEWLHV